MDVKEHTNMNIFLDVSNTTSQINWPEAFLGVGLAFAYAWWMRRL